MCWRKEKKPMLGLNIQLDSLPRCWVFRDCANILGNLEMTVSVMA
jgi:hypothetical protein